MQNKNPLVTVYTINRNYGQFIEKCIKSVLNQDYKNIEYIIIDDGSNDKSSEIIKYYSKKFKFKCYFQKNIGLVKSINKAIKVSNGKYVMRVDSDDFLTKTAVNDLIKTIYKYNSDLVFPDYYLVDINDKILKRVKRHNFNKKITLLNQPAHGACTLYKKTVFEEVGFYSKKFDCQDGVYMWIKVINKYKISNINKPLFYYRQHPKSLTKNYQKILNTKKLIFNDANKKKSKNLCFFPIRQLNEIDSNPTKAIKILNKKIFEIKSIKKIKKIIISSPDEKIKKKFDSKKNTNIKFIKRDEYLSIYGLGLSKLLDHTIKNNKKEFNNFDNVIIYIFNNHDISYIDLLINNLDIFNLDTAILARINKQMLFKHNGSSLRPIIKYKSGLQIERDAVYEMVSGIIAKKLKHFKKQKKIISGKIGQVLLNEI